MGLADWIANIIRPRPRGLFAPRPTAHEALSSAMIADGATAAVAREATLNFIRALSRDAAASKLEDAFAKLAGYADTVTCDTPPPVMVTDIRDEFPQIRMMWDGVALRGFAENTYLEIEGAQHTRDRHLREVCRRMFAEQLTTEIVRGIREARVPIVF